MRDIPFLVMGNSKNTYPAESSILTVDEEDGQFLRRVRRSWRGGAEE